PSWINVLSVTRQFAATHPPPIPIHVEEYSACFAVCCVAVGTVQSPVIALKSFPPFSIEPWLYPDQLLDWFALIATIGPCEPAACAGAAIRMVAASRASAGR